MDQVEATPSKIAAQLNWDDEASRRLDRYVESYPVLTRISAAKRLRDFTEEEARRMNEDRVSEIRVVQSYRALKGKAAA